MSNNDVPLVINKFMGVSSKVLSEALPDPYFKTLQNVYERKFDELQRRGGSTSLGITLPTNITGIDNNHHLKLRGDTRRRIAAVHCTPPAIGSVPSTSFAAVSWVNGGGGPLYWNAVAWGSDTGAYSLGGRATHKIVLQYLGYGLNWYAGVDNATLGSPGATQRLQVVISPGWNTNITGINVYANTCTGQAGGYNYQGLVWVGFIDLTNTSAYGIYYFDQVPDWSTAALATTTGSTAPTFTTSGGTGGTLTSGKEYYVAVLSHVQVTAGASYYQTRLASVHSITLGESQTKITISGITGDSQCYAIAVGESPQLLAMQYITNATTTNEVTALKTNNPNLVGTTPFDASNTDYKFQYCDTSVTDMFVKYDESGNISPIYVSGCTDINKTFFTGAAHYSGAGRTYPAFYFTQSDVAVGTGQRYCFAQLGEKAFVVNDKESDVDVDLSGSSLGHVYERSASGLYQTDGLILGPVIVDYGTSFPPKSKYLTTFQESLIIGGGSKSSDSYNQMYFSNGYNPYNFSQSGGAALAFIQVEEGGQPITGLGVYSLTTANEGPKTELMIGKRNSLYKLRSLPTSFTTDTFMDVLSKRVGIASHFSIANTEAGTMFASEDNVYIVNPDGEPIAAGDDISNFLRPEDPSTGIDTSYWNACYHDGMYKLAYSVSASARPTKELWLNVMKMKASKGQPIWYGPHTGRQIDYSITDSIFVAAEREKRFCVDITNKRIYQADYASTTTDFGSNIAVVIETHDVVQEQMAFMNKLLTCFQWKAKMDSSVSFTDDTYIDEASEETQTIAMAPPSGYSGGTYSAFLSARTLVYTFYPILRLRGREIRKRLSYSGTGLFSISGLVLFFKPERRRIDPR